MHRNVSVPVFMIDMFTDHFFADALQLAESSKNNGLIWSFFHPRIHAQSTEMHLFAYLIWV